MINPFIVNGKKNKVTIIAFANLSLLIKALTLLNFGSGEEKQEENSTESPICIPKIHINGRGQNSGRRKWYAVFKQISFLHGLFMTGENGTSLPVKQFKEWKGRNITWKEFVSDVELREQEKYAQSVIVVDKFRDRTMEALDLFQKEVIDKNYIASEADVILTTCHAAKGMEWDNVELCDDFINLANFELSHTWVLEEHPVTSKMMTDKEAKSLKSSVSCSNSQPDSSLEFHSATEYLKHTLEKSGMTTLNQKRLKLTTIDRNIDLSMNGDLNPNELKIVNAVSSISRCHQHFGHMILFNEITQTNHEALLKNQFKEPSPQTRRKLWQFKLSWKDDINLLYVACTRAKKTLSLPKSVKSLLQDFDFLHNFYKVSSVKDFSSGELKIILGENCQKLSKQDGYNLYRDLCIPTREEIGLHDGQCLMDALVDPCED